MEMIHDCIWVLSKPVTVKAVTVNIMFWKFRKICKLTLLTFLAICTTSICTTLMNGYFCLYVAPVKIILVEYFYNSCTEDFWWNKNNFGRIFANKSIAGIWKDPQYILAANSRLKTWPKVDNTNSIWKLWHVQKIYLSHTHISDPIEHLQWSFLQK